MPQNALFPWTRDLLVSPKTTQRHFLSTLHPLPQLFFAIAAVVAFVLLCNSRFSFHCYTQWEAKPTQKSARKWHCNLLRFLAWKITKGIHSCKPASLNRPIESAQNLILKKSGRGTKPSAIACSSHPSALWPRSIMHSLAFKNLHHRLFLGHSCRITNLCFVFSFLWLILLL